jgi:hypothetical protein
MLMIGRTFLLCLGLCACVAPALPEKVWDLGSVNPQVTISGPQVSNGGFTFVATAVNPAAIPICFDGNEEFLIGIGLQNADTGANLSWVDGPISASGGGVSGRKYVIQPGGSISHTITVPRPLSGPYDTPFVASRYAIGDQLYAVAGEEFYACKYNSTSEASMKEGTLVVFSAQSALFQENE